MSPSATGFVVKLEAMHLLIRRELPRSFVLLPRDQPRIPSSQLSMLQAEL